MIMDENKGQEANTANPWQQENKDGQPNPNDPGKSLEDMTKEELLEYHKEYRKNSEKGVQKLNQKLKDKDDEKSIEERAREIAKEELDKVYIDRTLTSIHNQLATDEQREAFNDEFDFLTEWRKLTSDNVDKYIKKALDLVWGKKPRDIIWMNVWWSISKEPSSKVKAEQRKDFAKSFVEKMWL